MKISAMAQAPSPSTELCLPRPGDRQPGSRVRPAGAPAFRLRPSEWLLLAYFLYAAFVSPFVNLRPGVWMGRAVLTLAGVGLLLLLARAEAVTGSRVWSIVRDWLPPPLILIAYWAIDWFLVPAGNHSLERSWIVLDRLLLTGWGGRSAIEFFGPVVPFLLELSYSTLYAIPPVSIVILYLYRRRARVDRFLFVLLLGTLTAYVLLPKFPSESPRLLFPGQDLPAFHTPFRALNLWLLDGFDIDASVFPSGHVTVGYSAAFAMLLALPERRRVGWILLGLATAVMVTTVYARYHYAVDGLAGLAISLAAGAASVVLYPFLRARGPDRGQG